MKQDALACLLAAIRGVDPARLIIEHLEQHAPVSGPVHVAGIGKAAGAMMAGARAAFGERLAQGTLIIPDRIEVEPIPGVDVFHAGHPIPDSRGAEGAASILRLAEGLGEDDLLLCLISGGGSALMTLPPRGVTLEEVQQTTDLLLRAGATIQELNCVRKHLDRLKGGRLARLASPARVLALVLSDVVGDPLYTIASGPVSPDPTTFATAVRVLEHRNVWPQLPDAVQDHLMHGLEEGTDESPGEGDPCFERVDVRVVGNNRLAAEAARQEAERRGYHTRLLSTFITGEAREVGGVLAALGREARQSGEPIAPPACLVAGGETTVTVRGNGRGGRNQELVLGAALELDGVEGIVVASVGTDGIDGPTDAAGAVADGATIGRARDAGLDPHDALARSDSYSFFKALDDLIVTGPTGTNVMDIQVVLVSGASVEAG